MGAPYIYDISRLRVKDLHSATYIYVVRHLRVKCESQGSLLSVSFMAVSSNPSRWHCKGRSVCFVARSIW